VDQTLATDILSSTAFLYTGANPIQTGVNTGTIAAQRVAVLRGRVLDRAEQPLPGVTISVLNHAEFGQTLTRADGMFDLAVNGGGQLTLRYEKDGFLAAQRAVDAPWRDYAWLPDVVLIPYDSAVTAVDLSAGARQPRDRRRRLAPGDRPLPAGHDRSDGAAQREHTAAHDPQRARHGIHGR
jgi:hypothetical protein